MGICYNIGYSTLKLCILRQIIAVFGEFCEKFSENRNDAVYQKTRRHLTTAKEDLHERNP